MSDESSEDNSMKQIWQSQPTEGVRMSVAEVQARAGKFQRRILRRNMREYVAAAAMMVFFTYEFWRAEDLLARIGFALIIAGIGYLAWQLHSRGSSSALPKDVGLSSFIDFQRRELVRQRDALRSVWRWYLGPLVPGMAMLIVAFGRANPGHLRHMNLIAAIYAAAVGAVFVAIARLNSSAARRLQRQIDELDEAGR